MSEKQKVAVIGAGSWGTALALVAARNHHEVRLWARQPEAAQEINDSRRNPFYLSDFDLPENLRATSSLEEAIDGADFAIIVVPSHALRQVIGSIKNHIHEEMLLVSATKGVENGTLMRMSEVINDILKDNFEPRLVALSGPSFAREVALHNPTAIVAASNNRAWSEAIQRHLSSSSFRVYTNKDVAGVEFGGAVKNVAAIASGVVRGMGLGHNSIAAIITRGLAEITRFAVLQGAQRETMAGLAGLGDLVLTCTGDLSRNRHVGVELGRGRLLSEILSEMREVAEGVKTTQAIYDLSRRLNVEMPITESVYELLYQNKPAREALNELMSRPLKDE
jgi:glycerol-3-phosphate dehydrogenase (NAD(P)+)